MTPVNDAGQDSDAQALFEAAVRALAPLKLAFLHLIEGQTGGPRDVAPFDYAALRAHFDGAWMVNNGYDRAMAIEAVASGTADARRLRQALHRQPRSGAAPARRRCRWRR